MNMSLLNVNYYNMYRNHIQELHDDCVRFIESDMLFTSGMLYKELITLPIGTYAKDGDITEDEEIELIELVRGLDDDVLKAYENRKKANQ